MKDLLSKKTKKRIKKSLSIILAVALFMEMFVMPGNNSLNGIFNVPTVVYAADDPDYIHDGSNNITVDISQLVAYSQAYQNYPEYHQYDNITIGATSSSNYYLNGFAGIGTDAYPFKGSIALDTNFNAAFNLNKPLFNAVCDTVQINGGNEILISRKYQGTSYETMPIFATKVVSGDSGVAKASWNITIVPNKLEGNDIMLAGFGGIIGEIGDGAAVSISATMNVDNAETYSDKTIAITGSSDIGLICGKIGENAALNCTMNGDRVVSRVTTTSGNAGGLVGTMGAGSVFNYSQTTKTDSFIADSANISTSTGDYAGGLIGQNNGGTFTLTMPQTNIQIEGEGEGESTSYTDIAMYPVKQTINAQSGSGGIYGYYKPAAADTINTGLYSIDCTANGNGSCGGLIGELETSYDVTVSRTTQFPDADILLTHSSGSGNGSNIGGLIGSIVSTDAPDITVSGVSVDITKSEGGAYYGGAVGLITNKTYIGFNDFALTDADNCALTFGGLVGKCDKAFVNVGDVDIDVTGKIKGGGLVGDIGDGVLRMTGNIDLTGAESDLPTKGDDNTETEYKSIGQIVGNRDDALIFMEKDCTLTRSTNVPEVDDVGTWGEILRFSNTTEADGVYTNYMGENSVLTVNGSTHEITIGAPTLSIGSPADFAKTSLCFQIDTDNTNGNPFASLAEGSAYTYSTINQSNIEIKLSADVDLAGTGLLGLTRDNDTTDNGAVTSDKCVFKGTFDGNSKKLTLAIGDNSTGFNGKIYRHKFSGLFAVIDGGTVKNVTFAGAIRVKSRRQFMYAGAAAAMSTGTFTASGITGNTVFTLENGDGSNYFNVGRLLGAVSSTGTSVSVSSSSFNGNINATCTNDNLREGGVIGVVAQQGAVSISFDTVTTKGDIKNTSQKGAQRIGGLISEVDDASDNTVSRKITLKNVAADGLTINGSNSDKGSIGGMLGYRWRRIDVEVDGVTVGGTSQSTVVSDGTNNNAAGLVYQATGYWNVKSLTFTNFKASCGSGASFGLLVNDGRDGSNRIYMDLRNGYTYTISSATFDKPYTYFDELVAYTWSSDVMNNGQGIISVHIADSTNGGLTMDGSTACGTYQAQTDEGKTANPNSRYYYNLDTITGTTVDAAAFTDTNADVNKLMSWAVNRYAAENIKKYFYASFASDGFDSTHMGKVDTTYDLVGYSWYPINVGGITVNGTYKLYNKEFEGSESQNIYARTSLYNTTEKHYTQHKLMQNALFYKVNGNLTIGKVALDGTVSVAKSGEGSGALIFDTISGSSSNNIKFSVTTSLTLDGIKVDYGTQTYAPLLINKVGSNIEFNVSHVYLTSAKYSNAFTSKAATSLIGKVGNTSAEQLKVVFNDIGLDGRSGTMPSIDSVYGTTSSIFSRATLIEEFSYKDNSGSYGRYTFSHGEDWDETDNTKTTRLGRVTYGSEISDSTSRKEYYGQEFWYNNTTHDSSGSYVNPEGYDNPASPPYNFSSFLPYVYKTYGSGYHQLEVNHDAAKFGGCGTYNDPYAITAGSQLVTIAKIIDGTASLTSDYKILIDSIDDDKWCDSLGEHVEYYYNSGVFTPTSGSGGNLTMSYVREYLSNAYYSFETDDMEIPDGFPGLGAVSDSEYVFKGVIVGNGNKVINKSDYPLIYASNGSAIYNLNIEVDKAITLSGSSKTTFASNSGCPAYGAVIGRVMGGDNVIDHVQVSYGENASFNLTGTYANTIPLGGYVGVVIKGGLIFRGMEDGDAGDAGYYRGTVNITGLSRLDASKITNDSATTTITETVTNDDETTTTYTYNAVSSDNKKWLYINPIIGRVLNGYAITEAKAYRPFDDGTRTYPDGSKDYCIVSGESVSFVDDDHYDSSTNTLAPVTMQNGTKNYSIADIGTSLSNFTMDGYTTGANVGVPNAQSLYIISLITQSGLGTSNNGKYDNTNNILKPYTDYMATHVGSYHYVGLSTLNDADPPTNPGENGSAGQKDYAEIVASSAGDKSGTTNADKVPYLIKTYSPYLNSTNPYPAFDLNGYTASSNGSEIYLNISFTGDESTFYLPDGFRGLGALMYGQDKWWSGAKNNKNIRIYHGMFINSLNGNNKNISLNMSLLLYSNDYENYLTTTGPQNHLKAGFGFFDVLRSNYTESNGNKIKDFTIKGNIKYDIINKDTGNHTTYNDNSTYGLNTAAKPAVGGLAGAPGADTEEDGGGGSIYLENIKLDNLSVYGMRAVGGMFGCTNATSKYYYMGCSADNLRVTGISAGGMIGYIRHGSSQFEMDFGGKGFNIISIECLSSWNPGAEGAASAGGLIGHNYANKNLTKNNNNESIVIKNVNINNASSFDKGYIGYSTAENNTTVPAAGGVIGTCTRNGFVRIENVNVNNIDICGKYAAGMIGYSNGRAKIYQSKVTTAKDCVIESKYDNDDSGSSGYVAYPVMGDATYYGVYLNDCELSGYNIKGYRNQGGIVGRTTGGQLYNINIDNVKISEITFNSNQYCGSLVGRYQDGVIGGYNILCKDITFDRYTPDSKKTVPDNYGYIIGQLNTYATRYVKLAGFSRQGKTNREQMVGNYADTVSYRYGTKGYVAFADFNGTALITSTQGKNQSGYKATDAEDNVSETRTNDNWPYVSTSPFKNLDSSGTPGFLTGDGTNVQIFNAIISDTSSTKKYSAARSAIEAESSVTSAAGKTAYYNSQMSLITGELSDSYIEFEDHIGIVRFPLLLIEDTNPANTTNLINNYLRTLTNTGYTFSNKTIDYTNQYGYGFDYDIDLIKMRFNGTTFEAGADGSACLKWDGTGNQAKFRMYANDIDSGSTAQFSLIDLKFYDPLNRPTYDASQVKTSEGIVAYHVYVPVFVKKMKRFNFTAKIDSGTDYFTSHYTNAMKNGTLFENLGNPVTIEMEYNYDRTASEWKDAINGGDSTLTNYYKRIAIKSHVSTHAWPTDTTLVLVDASNNDKFYYLDNPASKITFGDDGIGYMDLWDFVDDSGEHYKPVDFYDLLENVVVTQSAEGTLTTTGATADNAVVKTTSGNTVTYYTTIPANTEIAEADRYTVSSVGGVNNETYYLSIFTKNQNIDRIFRYEIYSVDSNLQSVEGKWSIPDAQWSPNKIKEEGTAQLFTGKLYTNTLRTLVTDTDDHEQLMGEGGNLKINVEMTSTVALTDSAITNGIQSNLRTATNARIYQTFMVSMDMKEDEDSDSFIGIKSKPTKSSKINTHYWYSLGSTFDDANKVLVSSPAVEDSSSSFIELRNGQDLRTLLVNNQAVSFKISYDLLYSLDQILAQFPKGVFDSSDQLLNGTKIVGYSGVGASIDGAAYSSNVDTLTENKYYYSASSSAATLKYNTDEEPYSDYDEDTMQSAYNYKSGPYSMLGVNPTEEDGYMYVSTYAVYNPSMLIDAPDYIQMRLTLRKRSNYNDLLNIATYISDLKIYGNSVDAEDNAVPIFSQATDAGSMTTTYTVTVPKLSLQKKTDTEEYIIPITFKVKTGTAFEAAGLQYSNYMVDLEVDMREAANSTSAALYSLGKDHIIYTNARVVPEVIQQEEP